MTEIKKLRSYTCNICGETFTEFVGKDKKYCASCFDTRRKQQEKTYRDRRRQKSNKKTRDENIAIGKQIVEIYLQERGIKSVVHTKDVQFWAVERNLIPSDWDHLRTLLYLARGLEQCYTYKRIGEKQYGLS